MSVSVDTVYQRVLAIVNKEQRGYITPQEFNIFANQAQLDIFEQYFYDINQFSRIPGNNTEYADILNLLREKIAVFEKRAELTYDTNNAVWLRPSDMSRLGTLMYDPAVGLPNECDLVSKNELIYLLNNPYTRPTKDRPVYVEYENGYEIYFGQEQLFTNSTVTDGDPDDGAVSKIKCDYIKKPALVNWAYQDILGAAQYNSAASVDFELHSTEEVELVFKILEIAGIAIKDPSLYQISDQTNKEKVQQEKS